MKSLTRGIVAISDVFLLIISFLRFLCLLEEICGNLFRKFLRLTLSKLILFFKIRNVILLYNIPESRWNNLYFFAIYRATLSFPEPEVPSIEIM